MRKLKNTELNRKSIDDFKKSKKTAAIVILDNIRSIHNVGSIFRTSDSFLIEKIIISGYTATPENDRMKKTALGSSDSVDWEYSDDIIETIKKLQKKDVKIISIEQADESLKIEKFNPVSGTKYAFIFGNEVDGVSDDIINVSDEVVEIPQVGTKHSLNVSVAAGIVLWDFFFKTEL
ncbi:MAG: TrmH family RNA methyltransferase [Candidatus Marisimplicoccus sp.]|jgi:23S rRNA (guanosine2251-2'-O)-methyltransferase|nr:TrmH family RNA methyltransferase [Flavobacteriaceae bacterium]MDA9160688.1 TrmH family RNA methyltransferase [Flavobacteriaceae bacterium]MDA9203929.1 TrmH family RNA methyltransferase [Flavobacteriaceae bacterium]MDA9883384.1 TrmH family RNA methyltransferase [Flavobacteriaceae bacterium]MDC1009828.1 TrmH family RNA methyltransferase [Flavobacteriaceae bacterium]|tara:strand:+ start:22 stop:552 length:531 start_codon:yes stop_codon:yes gene_type:complete